MTSRIPLSEISRNCNSKKQFQPTKRIEICNLSKLGFSIAEIDIKLNINPSNVLFTVKKYDSNSSRLTPP